MFQVCDSFEQLKIFKSAYELLSTKPVLIFYSKLLWHQFADLPFREALLVEIGWVDWGVHFFYCIVRWCPRKHSIFHRF